MEQGDISLDEIEHWSVQAMKDFLRVRGLKTTGRKRELQSLVYSAMQMQVPIKMDEVEEDKLRSKLYSESLVVDGNPLPDPFTELKDGWLAEKDSRYLWPPLSYFEIAEYLLVDSACPSQPLRPSSTSASSASSFLPTSLKDRLLSDYKEGKAFSYFESKWLKEIFYHHISEDSPVCFLKADCLPSQNVRSLPHKSWVVLEKKTGKIRSAYCTCFAGLGTTCNHVAAVVFKVDHAFMTGQSAAVPCTSKQCTWNVYKGMPVATVLEGKKISGLEWTRPSYFKKAAKTTPSSASKQLFSPVRSSRTKPSAQGLVDALFPSCQGSSVFRFLETRQAPQYSPAEDFNIAVEEDITTTTAPPLSMPELASRCNTVEEFRTILPHYASEEVDAIEQVTRGQAESKDWFEQRSGRVTASNMRAVMTRNQTLKDDSSSLSKDPVPLMKRLMGYEAPDPNLPNLKYGRLTEPIGRQYYQTLQKERGHQKIEVSECGLFVIPDKVFLGASPDGLVQCVCCGKGILEIKCCRTTEEPGAQNCAFLVANESGHPKLKKNHAYYLQVQAQLKATARQWCDFFVYTPHGFHLERLFVDSCMWEEAVAEIEEFFFKYMVPELVFRKIRDSMSQSPPDPSPTPSSSAVPTENLSVQAKHKLPPSEVRKQKRQKAKKTQAKPVFLCSLCSKECIDETNILEIKDNSIGCDTCGSWYHWPCVNVRQTPVGKWYCPNCAKQ